MLIEVVGFDGKPLWVESSKVLGVKPYGKPMSIEASRVLGVKPLPPVMCAVIMACIEGSEEWKLCDTADSVRRAVDVANAPRIRPPAEASRPGVCSVWPCPTCTQWRKGMVCRWSMKGGEA